MIAKYWSSSPFAHWLERRANFPEMGPMGGTMEEWDEHERRCKAINAPLYNFIRWLNTLQAFLLLPSSALHSVTYWMSCALKKTHVLPTTAGKLGQWMDLPAKIPDALFTAVIFYVEHECAHMMLHFGTSDEKVLKLNRKRIYGRTPRNLWFIVDWLNRDNKSMQIARMDLGRQWLNRYEHFNTAHGEDYSEWIAESAKILQVYEFAKSYFAFDSFKQAADTLGYDPTLAFEHVYTLIECAGKEEKRQYYELVSELDVAHDSEVDRYLKMIVELRQVLWT